MCFTTVSLHCLMVTIFFRLHVMSYQRCAGREEEIKFNLQESQKTLLQTPYDSLFKVLERSSLGPETLHYNIT